MTHSVHTSAYELLPFEEYGNRRKNLSSSCDCISTFQVEVEDFDNEIFVLSVEAHDKKEANRMAERICGDSEILVCKLSVASRLKTKNRTFLISSISN